MRHPLFERNKNADPGHDEKNERNKRMTHPPRLPVPSGAEITEFAHCGFKSAP